MMLRLVATAKVLMSEDPAGDLFTKNSVPARVPPVHASPTRAVLIFLAVIVALAMLAIPVMSAANHAAATGLGG
ncbi:MAG: hypothetical protein U0X20_29920 [Caldilineaceae bacterium]